MNLLESLGRLIKRGLAVLHLAKAQEPVKLDFSREEKNAAIRQSFLQDLTSARLFLQTRPQKAQSLFLSSLKKNVGEMLGMRYEFTFEELCGNLGRKRLDSQSKVDIKLICDEINEQLYSKERLPREMLADWMDRLERVFEKF